MVPKGLSSPSFDLPLLAVLFSIITLFPPSLNIAKVRANPSLGPPVQSISLAGPYTSTVLFTISTLSPLFVIPSVIPSLFVSVILLFFIVISHASLLITFSIPVLLITRLEIVELLAISVTYICPLCNVALFPVKVINS